MLKTVSYWLIWSDNIGFCWSRGKIEQIWFDMALSQSEHVSSMFRSGPFITFVLPLQIVYNRLIYINFMFTVYICTTQLTNHEFSHFWPLSQTRKYFAVSNILSCVFTFPGLKPLSTKHTHILKIKLEHTQKMVNRFSRIDFAGNAIFRPLWCSDQRVVVWVSVCVCMCVT